MPAQYVLVRCPVCSGSGSIKCIANHHPSCIILLRSEESCDGKGWIPQGHRTNLFCLKEGRRP